MLVDVLRSKLSSRVRVLFWVALAATPLLIAFVLQISISVFRFSESAHQQRLQFSKSLDCQDLANIRMPPVRSARNRKPPPDGFDDIEDTLLEFSNKMKDAENASHEGKKRHEVLWPIFQINHQSEHLQTRLRDAKN